MSECFNALLKRPIIQEIMDKSIKDNYKQEDKSDHKRLSNLCGRKEARVGLLRANEISKTTASAVTIGPYKTEVPSYKASWWKENKSKSFIRASCGLPPVTSLPNTVISQEHSNTNLKDFLAS